MHKLAYANFLYMRLSCSQYFKTHISRLLSHTIRLGCGGAEGAVGGDEPPGGDMDGDIDTDEVC